MKKKTLNKYTLEQYINLPDEEREEYKAFGLHLRACSCCRPSDILEWPWAEIKQIQDLINKDQILYDDMIEILCIASGDKKETVLKLFWFDVFKLYNFVVKGIKQINEIEKQLNYEPSSKEISAGIELYSEFSWFVTLNRLAGGDPLKYEAIGQMKYADIFATLKLQKFDNEFQKRLNKQDANLNI